MRYALLTATALGALALTPAANAGALVASFSQNNSVLPTIIATNPTASTTMITAANASTSITAGQLPVISNALFSMSATSVTAAVQVGSQLIQRYSGSFCFTSGLGCTGTNYISGVFSDAAFGANGGPGLTVNVNNPPDTLTLTSSVLPAGVLLAPNTFNLDFANVTPLLHLTGTTIAAFTADFAGNISASSAVAEPATIGILGMGVLGLAAATRRRKPVDEMLGVA